MISALIQLECTYNCKIKVLSVDAGKNLLEKNVKIIGDFDREDPRMQIGDLEQKTGIQVINNLRDSHCRVLAENRIKLARRILRQFFKIKRNSKAPTLTRTELQLSLCMAGKMINDIPYLENEGKGEILSPQMILNPGRFIGSLDMEENSDLANVNHMISRIKEFLMDFKILRKQEIITTSEKYMSQHFRNQPNPRKYEIKIGDLVFIKDKNKYDDFTFGRVKSINGSDALLDTKHGEVKHQIALLKIFAPSSVSLPKT